MPTGCGQIVESLSEEERPGLRAELSLEISRLVSRLLNGDEVDTAACGEELAGRFPDVGMSGEMIAEAIVSAAGMVGMIREGGAAAKADAEEGVPTTVDDELAAAVHAELNDLVSGQAADSDATSNGNVAASEEADAVAEKRAAGIGAFIGRGAIAAFRRTFSRG
jgi:hypothetical protein